MRILSRILLALAALAASVAPALAQSGCAAIGSFGTVLTAGQWQTCFQGKQDNLGFVPLNRAGGTMTGPLVTAAPTASVTGLRLLPGTSPTSPINGDLWTTSTGIFARINGSTFDLGIGGTGPVPIANGGTGASTAAGARTNLGLGTIATQDASAVAITGGTITGMGIPSANGDVANKQYVDSVATGLHSLAAAQYATATATVLPNTPTYSNGASGVGATLTAGANAAIVVDGVTLSLNDRVVVKSQASALQNGVYSVTTVGSGAAAWVLTRVTDFDTAAEMVAGTYVLVTAGATNSGTSWVLGSTVTTVGTTAVSFNQFASQNVLSFTARAGAVVPQADDYASFNNSAPANCKLGISVAANALTVSFLSNASGIAPTSASPCVITFRSSTASASVYAARVLTTTTSLTVSSGSTLGASNGVPFRIWITAHDDAGTVRIGVIKAAAATQFYSLDEAQLVSSTAEGGAGGADSAGVFYTGTAVSAKAFRVMGYMTWESGLTTAGTWATAATVIQNYQMGMAKPGQPIGNSIIGTATTGGTCTTAASYQDSILTASITPRSAANWIQVAWAGNLNTTAPNQVVGAVARRGGAILGFGGAFYNAAGAGVGQVGGSPTDQALSTSPVTYTVACISDGTNAVVFPANAGGLGGGGQGGTIVLTEIQG